MASWKVIENLKDVRVSDIVKAHNGYETFETQVSEHDLSMGSVSNGLHNERAWLVGSNFGYATRVRKASDKEIVMSKLVLQISKEELDRIIMAYAEDMFPGAFSGATLSFDIAEDYNNYDEATGRYRLESVEVRQAND